MFRYRKYRKNTRINRKFEHNWLSNKTVFNHTIDILILLLEIIEYLYKNNCPYDEGVFVKVTSSGDFDIIKSGYLTTLSELKKLYKMQ